MAQIKADEITKIIREQIENYDRSVTVTEVGTVVSIGDGVARIHGLDNCMAGELLDFPCLLYTSPSPRDLSTSRMPSSA